MFEYLRFPVKLAFALVSALVIGFYFNLEMPRWAIMTAGIVAGGSAFSAGGDPYAGALRLRGILRIIGTFIGSSAALILIILFARTPSLLLLTACAWAGFCVWVSTLVRIENTSAMATASYTALTVLVTVYASNNMTLAPVYAIERCSEIVLGIFCALLADVIFSPKSIKHIVEHEAETLITLQCQLMALAATSTDQKALDKKMLEILRRSAALKSMVVNLKMEAGHWELASRRLTAIHIRSLTLLTLSLDIFLARKMNTGNINTDIDSLLQDAPGDVESSLRYLRDFRYRLAMLSVNSRLSSQAEWSRNAGEFFLLLKCFKGNLRPSSIEEKILSAVQPSPERSLESHSARVNGLRTFIATGTAAFLWLYSGWTSGSSCMILLGVVTALAMRSPNPIAVAKDFVYGMTVAAPISFLLYTVVIPSTQQSLILLCIMHGLVAFISGIFLQRRQLGTMGAFAGILNAVTIANPMVFNINTFTDNVLGQIVGSLFAFAVILLIPDRSQSRTTQKIMNTLIYSITTSLNPANRRQSKTHLPALYQHLSLLQSLHPGDLDKLRMSLGLIVGHNHLANAQLPDNPALNMPYRELRSAADEVKYASNNEKRKEKLNMYLARLRTYQQMLVKVKASREVSESVDRLVYLTETYHHAFVKPGS
ncbi:TPA: FUSC family protein [Klebsiella variicola]|nr:FUSC family protein [Klebsiella variicola]